MRHPLLKFLSALLHLVASTGAFAEEVQLAVAANFTAPMKQIALAFEKDTGHKVMLSFGSTGKLYAQIINGAPFDVFLAADEDIPAKLEREGGAVNGSRFTYAIGKLVLWSAQPGLVDAQGDVLRKNEFTKIAIASPKLAPYGAAAMETMTQMGLLTKLSPKLISGESIGQTFGFISTGNAELGFVALAQVYEGGKLRSGSAWIVPESLHSAIRQDAVLLIKGQGNKAAIALVAFLKTEKAKAVMRSFGYQS